MPLASTWMDPVIGLDVHIVLVPPLAVPTPLPMPFVGMVFDPVGMVVGAAIGCAMGSGPGIVLVNSVPATNCGTNVTNMMTCPHLPVPGPFAKGLPGNDAELYFGGLNVNFGGSYPVRLGEMALSCSDPVRMPTSLVLAIPKGLPVLVLKPPAPDLVAIVMSLGMKALGKTLRALRRMQRNSKWWKARSARFRTGRPGRWAQRWNDFVCFLTGHPVDVATGRLLTRQVDFELPGPLPLVFERCYDSSASGRSGSLGHGWTHSLEEAVWLERGCVVVRREDGREVEVSTHHLPGRVIRPGDRIDDAMEGFELRCTAPFTFELETRDGVIHDFAPVAGDPSGRSRLQCRRTRDGHRIELRYDRRGQLEWVRDSGGRLVGFEHDGRGRLIRVKLPTAHDRGWMTHRSYHYDANDDLVQVTDSQNASWRFEYVSHLMVQETDRTGLSFYFQYDGHGPGAKCVRTWGDGGIYDHVIVYDTESKRTVVENSLGETTVYEMDEAGQVVAVMDAMGGTTRYGYDDNGRETLVVDPVGSETLRQYDARGHAVRVVMPHGEALQIERDDQGWPQRVTDASGAETAYVYDQAGRLEARRDPDGTVTTFEWREGLLHRVTDARGARTDLRYDSAKLLASVVLPTGAVLSYAHDGQGRRVLSRDPRGAVTEARYDTESRLVAIRNALGHQRGYVYDPEGNVLEVQHPNRHIQFRYGHLHRMVRREEEHSVIAVTYDTEGRVVAVTNERGERYGFELDRRGRVVAEEKFDGSRTTYLRDLAGRVTQQIQPSGRTTSFLYGVTGQVLEAVHSDGSTVQLSYDDVGRLASARYGETELLYERDVMGRVVRESQDGGATWVSARYGATGLRERVESSLGAEQRIIRGPLGAPQELRYGGLHSHGVVLQHDLMGAEIARTLPGAVEVHWSRDVLGRPTMRRTLHQRTGATVGAPGEGTAGVDATDETTLTSYQWQGDDQLSGLVDAFQGPRFFDHDRRGRLVRERRSDGQLERAMDAVGNVFRRADGRDRHYGPGGQLLEAQAPDGSGVVRYAYDPDGNQVEKVEPNGIVWRSYYDGMGMLACVERHSPEPDPTPTPPGGPKAAPYETSEPPPLPRVSETGAADRGPLPPPDLRLTFAYDAFARRVRKTVVHLDPSGASLTMQETRFVWDGHVIAHELDSEDGLTTWYWDPGTFTPIAKEHRGQRYSITSNHLGTPTEMYDQLGQLVWQMQLDVFGVPKFEAGEAEDCPWRWPGQYEDKETGEYYNRYRYYDPSVAIYRSPDPIGLDGGIRLFGYVPDPALQSDPLGQAPLDEGGWGLYHIIDSKGKVVYVGITGREDFGARRAEHRRTGRLTEGYELVERQRGLTHGQVRGYEQADIAHFQTRDTSRIGEAIEAGEPNRCWSFDPARVLDADDVRADTFRAHYEARRQALDPGYDPKTDTHFPRAGCGK